MGSLGQSAGPKALDSCQQHARACKRATIYTYRSNLAGSPTATAGAARPNHGMSACNAAPTQTQISVKEAKKLPQRECD